jgi:Domain of unknown function (DUF4431)
MRALLFAVALASLAGSAQAAECMRDNVAGQIAEGRLSKGMFEDAAGNPEQAYVLTLPVPACLSGGDAEGSVDSTATIHVYSSDETVSRQLEELVGRDVHLRGTPFVAHTAHHHAPIVMEVSEIDEI